jgi:hypothetical protein
MSSLPSPLRKQLETTIKAARKTAEDGAQKALEALAVHEADPYRHMDDAQRTLRRKLRAQARQLGDVESQIRPGTYGIQHLAEKVAYDQWHRLLFARFLLENGLLISPEHEVSVTLADCEELAPSLGLKDAWAVAGSFTATVLPEAFRVDDPAATVDLPIEERNQLLRLLTGLPADVFTASDSLGWTYQFWQAERKDEVNAAGGKIGADELSPVTQLFTEDYMVDFLLDNTLGAWHAGKVLAANPKLSETAQSEDELRQAVALPGCPWKYLRFIQGKDGKWTPAAGTFDGWPKSAAALRALDPCMGSGHFVVAMFERLVALRLAEEKLGETAAVAAVIRDNLFGLEIDPRCTQIGAFNLALAAWRRVGHRTLPAMNLACSGLAPNTREADWLAIAGDNDKLKNGMARLYRLFQKAAVLGSLINPRAGEGDLLVAAFHELQPLLEKALAQETKDDTAHEMAVTARGLVKAAEILAGQFTLVATNVPYLGRGKQDELLTDYCERVHPEAKPDLATCFVERCLEFCCSGGNAALVTPQNWLFLGTYQKLREKLVSGSTVSLVAELGPGSFQTPLYDFSFVLVSFRKSPPQESAYYAAVVSEDTREIAVKAESIRNQPVARLSLKTCLQSEDCRILTREIGVGEPLSKAGRGFCGLQTGDNSRFVRVFWEIASLHKGWDFFQRTASETRPCDGLEQVLWWEGGRGVLASEPGFRDNGTEALVAAFEKMGVGFVIHRMGALPASWLVGKLVDQNGAVVIPVKKEFAPAIWAYLESPEYSANVRKLDNKVGVTPATLVKAPFDLARWQKVAAEKYPHGLPKPFSSDPTQWLFNGHPAGADQPLHVAVARLLGYRWPRQTGSSFPDCSALGPDGLETLADADGIVCLSATKGEPPAGERLRTLLAQALGSYDLKQLLATAGPKGSKSETLEEWLRDEFFDQHCALFHHRPFVWHIWDGLKNGFSALVNYHKLTHANLEKLTFAYLGDWIRRQQIAVDAGEAGSDAKLQAAKELQSRLKLILDGEAPYDIFVRWKPLSQQAIGWHPDLNDGVRMNIRPFAEADILRKKVKIKWEKDRGAEPQRDRTQYPWFWSGSTFTGNRVNDVHLTRDQKQKARTR